MICTTKLFGTTKEGQPVTKYTLANSSGAYISILDYGGIITHLVVPDKKGQLDNVVLGFDTLESYEKNSSYFGCITGRVAGRISHASFTLNGTSYFLDKNSGENTLHGGFHGLHQRIWAGSYKVTDTYAELILNLTSPDMDQHFPGTLDMLVTYRFDVTNTLKITYHATTDQETLLTLTNHSYFNLSGDPTSTILNHLLTLPANQFIATDAHALPTDIYSVKNSPFDFTTGKKIGKDILSAPYQTDTVTGYDHGFILNKETNDPIILADPLSGRIMTMTTTEACVVCYTGNFLSKDITVHNQTPIGPHAAICLETQYYPNAINADFLPTKTLKPNETYHHETYYHFHTD